VEDFAGYVRITEWENPLIMNELTRKLGRKELGKSEKKKIPCTMTLLSSASICSNYLNVVRSYLHDK